MRVREIRVSPAAAAHMWEKHRVEIWEAVEILEQGLPVRRERTAGGEKRYSVRGYTSGGRLLKVVFAIEARLPATARIITAFPPD